MEALTPAWNPARQCTATNRAGERCRRQPIPGGEVCVMHGGSVPAVREAAKLRLLAMVEPILSVFEEVVAAWRGTRCETCGKPTGDPAPLIRVGQIVLDRTGFGPHATMEIVAGSDDLSSLSLSELADRAEEYARLAREAADAEAARMQPAAIDGELLDEGFEVMPEEAMPEADTPWSIPAGEQAIEPANPLKEGDND